jgi:hypothetical protein
LGGRVARGESDPGDQARRSSEAQAQLEHGDTFVILSSRTLKRDELATIAAGLKPAPSTPSI